MTLLLRSSRTTHPTNKKTGLNKESGFFISYSSFSIVTPAKAGAQFLYLLDPRFRGDDIKLELHFYF